LLYLVKNIDVEFGRVGLNVTSFSSTQCTASYQAMQNFCRCFLLSSIRYGIIISEYKQRSRRHFTGTKGKKNHLFWGNLTVSTHSEWYLRPSCHLANIHPCDYQWPVMELHP